MNYTANFRIDLKIWKQFKRQCKRLGYKPSQIIRESIIKFLGGGI